MLRVYPQPYIIHPATDVATRSLVRRRVRCRWCGATGYVGALVYAVRLQGMWERRIHREILPFVWCDCPKADTQANLQWDRLTGSKSDDTPCDDRCTSARGTSCNCSCGGANHGKDHNL